MTYKNVSIAATIVYGALFVILLLFPGIAFWLFELDGNAIAAAIARRTSFLMLAISLIAFFSRNAPESEARKAICLGLAVSMTGLGLLGIYEFTRGVVGPGIFVAVVIEFAFVFAYWKQAQG